VSGGDVVRDLAHFLLLNIMIRSSPVCSREKKISFPVTSRREMLPDMSCWRIHVPFQLHNVLGCPVPIHTRQAGILAHAILYFNYVCAILNFVDGLIFPLDNSPFLSVIFT
jgi:hypothetical protein